METPVECEFPKLRLRFLYLVNPVSESGAGFIRLFSHLKGEFYPIQILANSLSVTVPSWIDWLHFNFSHHTEHHMLWLIGIPIEKGECE